MPPKPASAAPWAVPASATHRLFPSSLFFSHGWLLVLPEVFFTLGIQVYFEKEGGEEHKGNAYIASNIFNTNILE